MHWFRTKDGYLNLELLYEVSRDVRREGQTYLTLKFSNHSPGKQLTIIEDPEDVSRLEKWLEREAGRKDRM